MVSGREEGIGVGEREGGSGVGEREGEEWVELLDSEGEVPCECGVWWGEGGGE